MKNISKTLLTKINTKTGISKKTIIVLGKLDPTILEYLRKQIDSLISVLRAQLSHYTFQSGWSSAAMSKIETTMSVIDNVLVDANRIFNVIPWSLITYGSPELARLSEILRKDMDKVGGMSLGPLEIPGLEGVNSIEDLRAKRAEFSYKLQQMVNAQYYAESAKAEVNHKIRELQKWVEAIIYINSGDGESVYEFTGTIHATQTATIEWSSGVLTAIGKDYIINSGSQSALGIGEWYLYFDSGGAATGFEVTDEYAMASRDDNIRLAKLTVTTTTLVEISPYGSISYQ